MNADDAMDNILNHVSVMEMAEDKLTLLIDTKGIIELNMGVDEQYGHMWGQYSNADDSARAGIEAQILKMISENI